MKQLKWTHYDPLKSDNTYMLYRTFNIINQPIICGVVLDGLSRWFVDWRACTCVLCVLLHFAFEVGLRCWLVLFNLCLPFEHCIFLPHSLQYYSTGILQYFFSSFQFAFLCCLGFLWIERWIIITLCGYRRCSSVWHIVISSLQPQRPSAMKILNDSWLLLERIPWIPWIVGSVGRAVELCKMRFFNSREFASSTEVRLQQMWPKVFFKTDSVRITIVAQAHIVSVWHPDLNQISNPR